MRIIDKHTLLFDACKRFRFAAINNLWNGINNVPEACRWLLEGYSCIVIYTKESGYHTGGWWKNPDYERCWHLSISFHGGNEKKTLDTILNNLFGDFKKWMWVEPPYSEIGKRNNVWHYRLFCDENWQPIKPRGEVYNTQFTERGWKSFSEVNYYNQNKEAGK